MIDAQRTGKRMGSFSAMEALDVLEEECFSVLCNGNSQSEVSRQ